MKITPKSNDEKLINWGKNLIRKTEPLPGAFGLTVEQMTMYKITLERFEDAFEAVFDPGRRTPAAYKAKETAKTTLVHASRSLTAVAQAWPQMTDEKRVELQIRVRDTKPTPRPAPTAKPTLTITGVFRSRVIIEVRRPDGRRARPLGVADILVFSHVGSQMPVERHAWQFEFATGKSRFHVDFPADVTPGQEVFIGCVYRNARGTGPVSGQNVRLPGGASIYAA